MQNTVLNRDLAFNLPGLGRRRQTLQRRRIRLEPSKKSICRPCTRCLSSPGIPVHGDDQSMCCTIFRATAVMRNDCGFADGNVYAIWLGMSIEGFQSARTCYAISTDLGNTFEYIGFVESHRGEMPALACCRPGRRSSLPIACRAATRTYLLVFVEIMQEWEFLPNSRFRTTIIPMSLHRSPVCRTAGFFARLTIIFTIIRP